jgi:FtsP/CotA-like multicopper oxidase with cupredoxin domain
MPLEFSPLPVTLPLKAKVRSAPHQRSRRITRTAIRLPLRILLLCVCSVVSAFAQSAKPETCSRPAAGSTVAEPPDLHSQAGVLKVDLTLRSGPAANGQSRYCYVAADGTQSPTLRLLPGDLLILRLKNELTEPATPSSAVHHHAASGTTLSTDPCQRGEMTAFATNLHFHGLPIPPVCHQDEVLKTTILPSDAPFEYRIRIPADLPPGLYWYHPHIHGFTNPQVLGGASGALLIEGIERAKPEVAGLPERVVIIRDQDLLNPDAQPVQADSMPPPLVLRDAEGDILNTGTGGGKPAKDLSINFVPVAYPNYLPARIKIRPQEKQLWCVLNASAITYLDLQMLVENKPQMLGVVSLDGIPINENGTTGNKIIWQSHVLMPPAGRVGIIVRGPSTGAAASLITRTIDTGPAGENDPTRPLATIIAEPNAPEPSVQLAENPTPLPPSGSPWLGDVQPVRTRTLYFSEKPRDPNDPNSRTDFYLTVAGQDPKLFDPQNATPDIVVPQGDVEDWIIENRTRELHAFHIHQIHFMLEGWNGIPIDEPFLRDTVNVAYWDGTTPQFPSVKLRMDFRDPDIVGTFLYHCHLLEHEDGGMMGVIQVVPKPIAERPRPTQPVPTAKKQITQDLPE